MFTFGIILIDLFDKETLNVLFHTSCHEVFSLSAQTYLRGKGGHKLAERNCIVPALGKELPRENRGMLHILEV